MKKRVVISLCLMALLIGVLSIASCDKEITTTVTATKGPLVVVLTKTPPEIPHVYFIDIPGTPVFTGEKALCFVLCHQAPADHVDWWTDTTLCTQCHTISDRPEPIYGR
jgi:hypothetical protein